MFAVYVAYADHEIGRAIYHDGWIAPACAAMADGLGEDARRDRRRS